MTASPRRSNSPPKAQEASTSRCVVGVARLRRPTSDNRQPRRRGGGSLPYRRAVARARGWGVRGGSSSSFAAGAGESADFKLKACNDKGHARLPSNSRNRQVQADDGRRRASA